jgi:predicted nucleic acid-binding protein
LRAASQSITACELFKGAYRSGKNENVERVRKSLTYLRIPEFSVDACERSGKLVNELHLGGNAIGDVDTMIVSIALRHGETLLASDKEHFGRAPGLTIETWGHHLLPGVGRPPHTLQPFFARP